MTLVIQVLILLVLGAGGYPPAIASEGEKASPKTDSNMSERALIVLVHGFTKDPSNLDYVRDAVAATPQFTRLEKQQGDGEGSQLVPIEGSQAFPDADILVPELPFGLLSTAEPGEVVAGLLHTIDQAWQKQLADGDPYRRIILVGHSMGALYARKIYVAACGENAREAPFESALKKGLAELEAPPLDQPRPWAFAVERVVLLAGMNRGWSISHHISLSRSVVMQAGAAAGWIMDVVGGRPPIIFSARRGAPFITQLRIQWLAMLRHAEDKRVGNALTVQLLGSIDDLVSPEDNVDLVTGREFVYLDVPQSGHENVVEMDATGAGVERREVFQRALAGDAAALKDLQVIPADTTVTVRPEVDGVIFVIHGIRDEGFWTHKIARRVIAKGRKLGKVIASETSSYGYFPMLSFLKPRARQEKVEWLMDQYTEALATYPNAEDFYFVGHSNGTYLLAKALKDYPAARFKRIVFAGSVVHRKYDWSQFMPQQTEGVLNFVASADWVVALFPKALQSLRIQDLGSAGHDGFDTAVRMEDLGNAGHYGFDAADKTPGIVEAGYVVGGHSAALREPVWDSIASFVITSNFEPPLGASLTNKQAWYVYYPGLVAPLLWLLAAAFLVWLLLWMLHRDMAQWLKTLLILAYIGLIWNVLTRF